jgi:Iap family predicted aminopeptidase
MRPFGSRVAAVAAALLLSDTVTTAATPARAADSPDPTAEVAARLQREELSSSSALSLVQSLCDEVGPRPAGSPGDRAAVAWALAKMKALGLANVHAEPVKVARWERGVERAEVVAPLRAPLVVTALGGSVGTGPAGVEAEIVVASSYEQLEHGMDAAAVHGKIVLLDAPTRRTRDGRGYGEAVQGRFYGARLAQKLGAVGFLLRSVGTDHDRLPHTGSKSRDDHEIPAAAISAPDADLVRRLVAEKKSVRVRVVLGASAPGEAQSANVIGEVTGGERPGEIVLVGAHLDSWDLGPGALDDGAGVAIALETGRLFAAAPRRPRRTLRVVLFANEEHGQDGALAYKRAHAGEAAAHAVAMEADLGADAVYAVRLLGDARERFAAVAGLLAPLGVERSDEPAYAATDVEPLRELGVPVLDLRQDATRYFDYHHSANDTPDKIDAPTLAQAAAAYATAAWAAADMAGDFGRAPLVSSPTR